MSYRTDKLVIDTRTHRPTDAAVDNTRRPKLASGKKSHEIMQDFKGQFWILFILVHKGDMEWLKARELNGMTSMIVTII